MTILNQWLQFLSQFLNRLRWRLTLSFTLVTLAAILMAAWWSFLALNIYFSRINPEVFAEGINNPIFPNLVQLAGQALLVLIIPAVLVGTLFGFLTARWLESRLNHLRDTTEAWANGNFKPRISDPAQDEIAHFGRKLNQMAAELETLLITRQQLAAIEERNQLARDLHDSVKQNLTAAILQLNTAEILIQTQPEAAQQALQRAEDLAIQAQQELTNVILELRPAMLHQKNLNNALDEYLQQWQQQNQMMIDFTHTENPNLTFSQELALFRIAQEALANVIRHSGATQVKVMLSCDSQHVILRIQDNGRGFDLTQSGISGFGLKSMRDRMDEIGGRLEIESNIGQGTTVSAFVPIKLEPRNEEISHD